MIEIDLIVPYLFNSPKFRKLPFTTYDWRLNWFPVWYNEKFLKIMRVKVRFLNPFNINYNKLSSIIGIDCRICDNLTQKIVISFLNKLKKKANYLVWFDTADSTGCTQFEVLPYVQRYAKKQILKDFSLYKKDFYRSRVFTDYYARKYNLKKDNYDLEGLNAVKFHEKFKTKIAISWNLGLCDYNFSRNKFIQIRNYLIKKNYIKFQESKLNRKIILAANFTTNYSAGLIAFQRKQLLSILKERYKSIKNISIGKVPKKVYRSNFKNARAIISPFGWGEICYRDFETIISGAALIKPDMSHLETWPNVYEKKKTYLPISWNIEDWEQQIDKIIQDEENLYKIASNGQKLYKTFWTINGRKAFCKRFIEIITPNQ